MLAAEVIRRKRDGASLSDEEIAFLVAGITDGELSDAQVGALAMALFIRGADREERVALTLAMRDSGTVLGWDLDRPLVDKHSTGGVGDKVSLILAPVLAACGGAVPMISGRGLGHTGGTLDKLDAIPGYASTPALEVLRRVVREVGCAIVGQTAELAPADRRLYAVRDATGTVESIPLIVASILSKKLAAGLDALVVDVKTGSGAFMAAREEAEALARALVEVAGGAGLPTVALLTDMDEVLGTTAGNALEVREAIDALTGAGCEPRLLEVTLALAGALLARTGLADDEAAGRDAARRALDTGAAAERFAAMVAALGGPGDLLEAPGERLPAAPVVVPVRSERPGCVSGVDCRAVGLVVTGLGGNRAREDDTVDPAVGLSQVAGVGAEVGPDRPLAMVHARGDAHADAAAGALRAAFRVGPEEPEPRPVVVGRVE
jgi:thymidine phosphorylase